jgi:hypothetical protein
MKIRLDNYFCCIEECQYSRECAQHTSAGDFRSEDGFKPLLYKKDDEIICESKDSVAVGDFKSYPSLEDGQGFIRFLNEIKDLDKKEETDYSMSMNTLQKLQKHLAEIPDLIARVTSDIDKSFEKLDKRVVADEARFSLTEIFAEGDSFHYWERWNKEYNFQQDTAGRMFQVGEFGGQPIWVSFIWYVVNGHYVCFYEATSNVVNWKMVEEWLKIQQPEAIRTDYNNFAGKIHSPGKWATMEHITQKIREMQYGGK